MPICGPIRRAGKALTVAGLYIEPPMAAMLPSKADPIKETLVPEQHYKKTTADRLVTQSLAIPIHS